MEVTLTGSGGPCHRFRHIPAQTGPKPVLPLFWGGSPALRQIVNDLV